MSNHDSKSMPSNVDEVKGRAKQALGQLTDDDELKSEGEQDEAAGKIKGAIDDVTDKAKGAIDALQEKIKS